MQPLVRTLLAVLALVLSTSLSFAAQDRAPLDAERRAELLERWHAKPAGERVELVRRFRALAESPREARDAFERRAASIARERDALPARLPAEWRAALEQADARGRRALLRAWQRERARFEAARVATKLPRALSEALDAARPAERALVLERWRESAVERRAGALGGALGLDDEARAALERLAPRERRAALAALHRRAVRDDVARRGLPAGIDGARWEELERLSDEDFLAAWRGTVRQALAEAAERLDGWPAPARPAPLGGSAGGEAAAGSATADDDGARGSPELTSALAALLGGAPEQRRAALAWLRVPAELRASLAELPHDQRAASLRAALRERLGTVLAGRSDLTDSERAALLGASGADLARALKALAPSTGRPPRVRGSAGQETPLRPGRERR